MTLNTPNTFQCPNVLIDEHLSDLGFGELKVLLVIIRKTTGWHKTKDRISLSQLESLTGLTRTNIGIAVNSLIDRKLIVKEVVGRPGFLETFYEINYSIPTQTRKGTTPSPANGPPTPVLKEDTQNTSVNIYKETTTTDVEFKKPVVVVSSYACLDELPLTNKAKIEISQKATEAEVQEHIKHAKSEKINNPAGYVLSAVRGGFKYPEPKKKEESLSPEILTVVTKRRSSLVAWVSKNVGKCNDFISKGGLLLFGDNNEKDSNGYYMQINNQKLYFHDNNYERECNKLLSMVSPG